MIRTRYPTEKGKLTIVNSSINIRKVIHRFWVSIHTRISLVELLKATSSRNTSTMSAKGRRNLRTTFLLRSLNIFKHRLILSFGEQFGLDTLIGDRLPIVGRHKSFALSMLSRFIVSRITSKQQFQCDVLLINAFEIYFLLLFIGTLRSSHHTLS